MRAYWSLFYEVEDVDKMWFLDPQGVIQRRVRSLLPHPKESAEEHVPGPIEGWGDGVIANAQTDGPYVDIASGTRPFVSDRLKVLLETLAPPDFQFLPLEVRHRGKRVPCGKYWIANWLKMIDCIDLNSTPHERRPGRYNWQLMGHMWLDPARIPESVDAFSPLGQPNLLIVSDRIHDALERARFVGVVSHRFLLKGDPAPIDLEEARRETMRAARKEIRSDLPTDIVKLFEVLREYGVAEVGKAGKPTAVAAAEKKLGVSLPNDYKRFLVAFSCADVCGFGIEGLRQLDPDSPLPHSDVVTYTNDWRRYKEIRWPYEMVCIGNDGRGGCYCLDTRKVTKGESCAVVYMDHERVTRHTRSGPYEPHFEHVASTFTDWIRGMADAGNPGPW